VVRNVSLWNSLIIFSCVMIAYSFLPTWHDYWIWISEQNSVPAKHLLLRKHLEPIQPCWRYIVRFLIGSRVFYVRSSILMTW
jgi:hypothetical protein